MNENKIIISVFIGSVREGRLADKAANWIVNALELRGHIVHVIDPNKFQELQTLRIQNHYNPEPSVQMQLIHKWLSESDGFVLVTPEYNHSFSGAIKNALDNFMPEYEKKPFGIVSYSINSFGGVRAAEALRIVVSELKGVTAPIHLMLPLIQDVFDESGKPKDNLYVERIALFLDDFEWYVTALKIARIKK